MFTCIFLSYLAENEKRVGPRRVQRVCCCSETHPGCKDDEHDTDEVLGKQWVGYQLKNGSSITCGRKGMRKNARKLEDHIAYTEAGLLAQPRDT